MHSQERADKGVVEGNQAVPGEVNETKAIEKAAQNAYCKRCGEESEPKNATNAIIGASIGGVLFLLVIVALIFTFRKGLNK